MPTTPISITLPQELLEQIKAEVNRGSYASVSEFIRDAVRDTFGVKDARLNNPPPGGFSKPIAGSIQSNGSDDRAIASWTKEKVCDGETKPSPAQRTTPAETAQQNSSRLKDPHDILVTGFPRSKSAPDILAPSSSQSTHLADSPQPKSSPPPVVIFNVGENSWITGKVERGQQLGGKLGFPTLNLDPSLLSSEVPHGVFVAEVEVADRIYQAAGHYGPRKTLGEWRPTLEFHLLDFDQHIPGHLVRFRLLKQIRETMKFDGLDQLKKQLADDVTAVRRFFGEKTGG